MSNEKDPTNRPLKKKKNNENTRTRNFSLTSYLIEQQIQICLLQHSNQIKTYAYALHDKDTNEDGTVKEPHFHIILCLYNATTVTAVRRWFSGYTDNNGKEINTLGQKCNNIFSAYDYLTHSTSVAIEQGKYQYPKSIIQTNNKEYFKADETSEYDNMTLAVIDMLNNVPLRELFKKYGRDFIIHYSACAKIVGDIITYENDKNYLFLKASEDYHLSNKEKILKGDFKNEN